MLLHGLVCLALVVAQAPASTPATTTLQISQSSTTIATASPVTTINTVTSTRTDSTAIKTLPPLPLTTVLTPAASCSATAYTYYTILNNGTSVFWQNAVPTENNATSSCYPLSFREMHFSNGYYSPGVCPQGWYAQETIHQAATGAWTSICCPSGMSHYVGLGCTTTVTTPTTVRVSAGLTSITTPFIAADWPIEVAWQSSDLDVFTPASAPLLLDNARSTMTIATTTTVYPSSSPDASTSHKLSAGAIAAICVAALLVTVKLTYMSVYCLRRRRQRRSAALRFAQLLSEHNPQCKPEIIEIDGEHTRHEAPATSRMELPISESVPAAELHAHSVAELPAHDKIGSEVYGNRDV